MGIGGARKELYSCSPEVPGRRFSSPSLSGEDSEIQRCHDMGNQSSGAIVYH